MLGRGQQVELHLGILYLYPLQGVDAPAHVSLRPNCGPWKLKDILVLWHCWRHKTNTALILLLLVFG